MNWFAKSDPSPSGRQKVDPKVLAAQRAQAQAEAYVEENLAGNPAFAVLTVDALQWIDPHTGTRLDAPFGHADPAREWLLANRPWLKFKAKTHAEMLRFRWQIHLKEHGDDEPRLKHFSADGRWLNPFTGQWVAVPPTARQPQEVAGIIAQALGGCPEAQGGRMLDAFKLDEIVNAAKPSSGRYKALDELDPDDRSTQRVSGSRAGEGSGSATAVGASADLTKAKGIIEKMLPQPPSVPGYGVMVHYEPHDDVGGDFFDFLPLPGDRWLIVLGDVAGHGVQGALVVVAALKSLRFLAKAHHDLPGLLAAWNDEVRKDLLPGQFITVFAAIFDPARHSLEIVCAGHAPACIANAKAGVVLRQAGVKSPAIGLMASASFGRAIRTAACELAEGDVLFQYTDGLSEAQDRTQREFTPYRVMGAVVSNLEQPYDLLTRQVIGEVKHFAGGSIDDDLTVLCIKREESAAV